MPAKNLDIQVSLHGAVACLVKQESLGSNPANASKSQEDFSQPFSSNQFWNVVIWLSKLTGDPGFKSQKVPAY